MTDNLSPENSTSDKPQDDLQLFTIVFNPKTAEITFLGSMSAEQASRLIQKVMRNQEKARIRQEVEAEIGANALNPKVVS